MTRGRSLLQAVYDAPEMRAIERSYIELNAFYVPYGGEPVQCRITNISPMGAQVTFPGAGAVPDTIHLKVPQIGLSFEAEVKWENGDTIGVQFIGSDRLDAED